jgi:hypothetical protein
MLNLAKQTPFSRSTTDRLNFTKLFLDQFDASLRYSKCAESGTSGWATRVMHQLGHEDMQNEPYVSPGTWITHTPLHSYFDVILNLTTTSEPVTEFTCSPSQFDTSWQHRVNAYWAIGNTFIVGDNLRWADPYIDFIKSFGSIAADKPLIEEVDEETIIDAAKLADAMKVVLSVRDDVLGEIVGVGRTTLIAWRKNRHEARPSKIAGVLQFHAVVSGLQRALGDSLTREWFHAARRIERLRSAATRDEVIAEANRVIYANAPRTWEASVRSDPPKME